MVSRSLLGDSLALRLQARDDSGRSRLRDGGRAQGMRLAGQRAVHVGQQRDDRVSAERDAVVSGPGRRPGR
ncbi:hypothetical protein [Micromonospora nigra]|uniref:hypothetical protein n=1 Tax=Micromonospora nigra TaxID=145857 RepID=UPI001585E670|nr:hypothetical protein [Micromonospora nigra]